MTSPEHATSAFGETRPPRRRNGVVAEVVLDADGVPFVVRSATARDRVALDELRGATEAIGATHSYFGATDPTAAIVETGQPWPRGGATVVAERGDLLIGAAHFARVDGSSEATVALAVRRIPCQREIGGRIVVALAESARALGVTNFVAELSTKNATMLAVFAGAGFATEIGVGDGIMHARFSVDRSDADAGRSSVKAVPVWRAVDGHSELLEAPGA